MCSHVNFQQDAAGDGQMMQAESYQTVTLVPSDNGQGEVSYVLVVQEEKPAININIKVHAKRWPD